MAELYTSIRTGQLWTYSYVYGRLLNSTKLNKSFVQDVSAVSVALFVNAELYSVKSVWVHCILMDCSYVCSYLHPYWRLSQFATDMRGQLHTDHVLFIQSLQCELSGRNNKRFSLSRSGIISLVVVPTGPVKLSPRHINKYRHKKLPSPPKLMSILPANAKLETNTKDTQYNRPQTSQLKNNKSTDLPTRL